MFALCTKWVQRCKPDLWIVNSPKHLNLPTGTVQTCFDPHAIEGATMTEKIHRTLAKILKYVPADHHVVIMEDDDWYEPMYVKGLTEALSDRIELSACTYDVRYNLPARSYCYASHAINGAAAGCVAIHSKAISTYAKHLAGSHGADHTAWQLMRSALVLDIYPRVSIKGVGFGLPGKQGATTKHDPESQKVQGWIPDPHLLKFRELLGTDAHYYEKLAL